MPDIPDSFDVAQPDEILHRSTMELLGSHTPDGLRRRWTEVTGGERCVATDSATAQWITELVESRLAELAATTDDAGAAEVVRTAVAVGYTWGRILVRTDGLHVSWSDDLDDFTCLDDLVAATDTANWDLHGTQRHTDEVSAPAWVDGTVVVLGLSDTTTEVVASMAMSSFDEAVVGAWFERELADGLVAVRS